MSDLESLLSSLDPLPHGLRMRAIIAWARATEPQPDALAELAGRDAWHRGVGVELAAHWGDAAHLRSALSDPSVSVRKKAASRCARGATLALVPVALAIDPATRRRVLLSVARHRRADLATALAEALLARGSAAELRPVASLLAWPQVEAIEAQLGSMRMPWRRLALDHPGPTLERLEALLTTAPHVGARELVWRALAPAVDVLVRDRAPALLDLLERHRPRSGAVIAAVLGPLLRRAPERTVALVAALGPDYRWLRLGHKRSKRVRALDDALVAQLARAFVRAPTALAALLSALPPSRRGAAFAVARAEQPNRLWELPTLELLPHDLRHAEIRRRRALPRIRADHDAHRQLAAWLPIDEAMAELVPQGRPSEREGLDRAATWALWTSAVGRERGGMDALLEASRFLANEQDPVRAGFLAALARVPVALLESRHVPGLDALLTAVVEARDTSYASRSALVSLAHRLLVAHAGAPEGALFQLGLRVLERTTARGHGLSLPRLDRGLRRGAERAIAGAVLAWLRADTAREAAQSTLSLATALHERAWGLDELQALLWELATTHRNTGVRQRAAGLWLADRAGRDERVRALLDHDESAIALHPVWFHVAHRRQDWLDPFLQGCKLRGRWGSSKAGWVPHTPTSCGRWLPRQQRALAELYAGMAADGGQKLGIRARMLGQLARLPVVGVPDLEGWIRHETVNLAEAALGGLVWVDEPAPALPILLDNLDSARARVAMYALPRLAALVPAPELEATLRALLERERLRVTVHKEAIRLLGAHRLDGSAELLRREWGRPRLHRDVRLALVHAAWARLDEAWAWEVLGEAARHSDAEVPRALAAVSPLAVPPAHHARLLELLTVLAEHPEPRVRQGLAAQLARDQLGLGPAAPGVASTCVSALWADEAPGSIVTGYGAHGALAMASLDGGLGALLDAVGRVRARQAEEPAVGLASEDPDVPWSRRLERLTAVLAERVVADRGRYASVAEAVLPLLGDDPAAWPVALALHPGTAAAEPILGLVSRAAAADQPALAALLEQAVADARRPWTHADLLALEEQLQSAPVLCVALVRAAARRHGWSRPLRGRLGALRVHPEVGRLARGVVVG